MIVSQVVNFSFIWGSIYIPAGTLGTNLEGGDEEEEDDEDEDEDEDEDDNRDSINQYHILMDLQIDR